jgi:hypothetical protein
LLVITPASLAPLGRVEALLAEVFLLFGLPYELSAAVGAGQRLLLIVAHFIAAFLSILKMYLHDVADDPVLFRRQPRENHSQPHAIHLILDVPTQNNRVASLAGQ